MHLRSILGIKLALVTLAMPVFAQTPSQRFEMPSPDAPLSIHELRGGAYWVSGGVSNAGFIVGNKGVIAIDGQYFPGNIKNELAEIAKITLRPVNVIILTHSDPDHINGLPAFPAGAEMIAQENSRREMVEALADPHPNFTKPPVELKDYLPTHTIKSREDLVLDGVRFILIHTIPAHTDGDLVVYLPEQKIVFAGDLLAPSLGSYPGIHLEKHGSSLGWIESTKAMLSLDADIFISGHGDTVSRADLAKRIQTVETRRAQIKLWLMNT